MAYSVDEASRLILADIRPLGIEHIRLSDALGRVLAEDVLSPIDHPPWDNSSMDGYAVHSEDVVQPPVTLPVLETIRAGQRPTRPLPFRAAIRIMTGAPVPDGADTVIRV